MQPPLSPDTLLQNRYTLVQVLGQGTLGRTYLAKDGGRFECPCAIKEFALQLNDATEHQARELAKAKELFQREAEVLYQLQHSQIPQFQAIFEENQRLFLVRDYVEGQTYQTLLQDQGPFSEADVRQFLQDILPVLDYIHRQGIIHQDLCPENIIQRQSDRLPVPIDFGVVKELATQLQSVQTQIQSPETSLQQDTSLQPPVSFSQGDLRTNIGYAPPDQRESGRAYPHSDLYGLAVTAIVLLTAKPPQDLYDAAESRWLWQDDCAVSEELAAVLNQMLSDRPGERYLTAPDVRAALFTGTATAPVPPPRDASPNPPNSLPSVLPTVMVSRAPDTVASTSGGDRTDIAKPKSVQPLPTLAGLPFLQPSPPYGTIPSW